MILKDIKNNKFEINGDGKTILVEFIEIGMKVSEEFANELGCSHKEALNNLFKTITFAIDNKEEGKQ